MPYRLYKKGPGYKACKPGGVECLSKKSLTKEKASKQRKAYYASKKKKLKESFSFDLLFDQIMEN